MYFLFVQNIQVVNGIMHRSLTYKYFIVGNYCGAYMYTKNDFDIRKISQSAHNLQKRLDLSIALTS